jgi:G3E family GTPase
MADVIAVFRGGAEAALQAQLRSLNPVAAIVDAATAMPAEFVGHGAFETESGDVEAWIAAGTAANPAASLAGEAGRIRAFAVARHGPMPFSALERFVEYLAVLQAANLIRVRGLVAIDDNESVVVEGAGSFFRPPLIVDRPTDPGLRFAVVARDLDRERFKGYLDAFLGEARVDRPDAAALTDNPLVVPGFSARSGK